MIGFLKEISEEKYKIFPLTDVNWRHHFCHFCLFIYKLVGGDSLVRNFTPEYYHPVLPPDFAFNVLEQTLTSECDSYHCGSLTNEIFMSFRIHGTLLN